MPRSVCALTAPSFCSALRGALEIVNANAVRASRTRTSPMTMTANDICPRWWPPLPRMRHKSYFSLFDSFHAASTDPTRRRTNDRREAFSGTHAAKFACSCKSSAYRRLPLEHLRIKVCGSQHSHAWRKQGSMHMLSGKGPRSIKSAAQPSM